MTRFARSVVAAALTRFILSSAALLVPVVQARAQVEPIVTITPRGKLVTNANRTIDVSVKFCMPWGGSWGWTQIMLEGVDITSQFTQTGSGQDQICDAYEIWSSTVTLNETPENQQLRAQMMDYYGYLGEDIVYYSIPAKGRAVLVASGAGFIDVRPSSSNSQQFTIWNSGEIATTYSLTPTCSGAASGCGVSPSSVWIASGGSASANVTFNSSATVNDTGLVKLQANDDEAVPQGTVQGEGWTDVTVKAAPLAGVTIARSMDLVPRGSCVTASIGSDAAMECGDLRLVHALPAVTTLGKARVPTLLYNSQHARPMPVVLADVTVPGGTLPSTVEARVYVGGVQRGYSSFAGSNWGAGGNTRRVAIHVDATGYGTSLRSYYVQVTLIGGPGGTYNSPTANLAIVDRSVSNFGAGWWLAGLEEIHFPGGGQLLWVGGDGSTRVYTWNGVSYKAPNFDRPDSITTAARARIRSFSKRSRVRVRAASNGGRWASVSR